jgi:hypothetical protein
VNLKLETTDATNRCYYYYYDDDDDDDDDVDNVSEVAEL